jgi:hypothetical protein
MIEQSRHLPLRRVLWNSRDVATAIDEIVADALTHFDHDAFWPAHPLDDEVSDGNSSIYIGAAGVIWALEYLRRIGATKAQIDFSPNLPRLFERAKADTLARKDYSEPGSLLVGDLGAALLIMRLAPAPTVADFIYARVDANTQMPTRELMWGIPGSMLASIFMDEMTGEPCWRTIYGVQAAHLLDDLKEGANGPMWIQDLGGTQSQYLGPVHGYAGNMTPLLRGWRWLTESQRARIADAVPRTLSQNGSRSDAGTAWPATVDSDRRPWLCQHCHGAPGMVTTFAGAPFTSPELEELLLEGGKFTWAAGPLRKGPNLCHGTGGNGYAFLKLYRRTSDALWLERARAFAMTAIAQCREARDQLGRGRYSLWTGDVGLAVYLWDCLTAAPRFPTVDIF